jgi:hypothetical protein
VVELSYSKQFSFKSDVLKLAFIDFLGLSKEQLGGEPRIR